MTKFHIMGDNFEKEEKWINSWIKKGYRLKSASSFALGYDFTPYEYSGEELENGIGTVRMDFRHFSKKADFEEYKAMFEDSGWKFISKSLEDLCFFEKTSRDASDDIFSDDASKASRYKRLGMYYLTILLAYIPCFIVFPPFNIDVILHPGQCFYTPGLWEMTGLKFLEAFLSELPFAAARAYSGLLFFLCFLFLAAQTAHAFYVYKKSTSGSQNRI